MSIDVETQTTSPQPPTPARPSTAGSHKSFIDEAEREMRQLAREQKQAERLKAQQAAQAKAARKRAEKLKDTPRPRWNEPERTRADSRADDADGSRYRAPPPPRAGGTWVRVGHMWMRVVTISARPRR